MFYDKKWDLREIKKYRKPCVRVPSLRDDFIKKISILLNSEIRNSSSNLEDILDLVNATSSTISKITPSKISSVSTTAGSSTCGAEVSQRETGDNLNGDADESGAAGTDQPCTCTCKCRRESFKVFEQIVPQDSKKYRTLNYFGISTLPDLQGIILDIKRLAVDEAVMDVFDISNLADYNGSAQLHSNLAIKNTSIKNICTGFRIFARTFRILKYRCRLEQNMST